MRVNRWTLRGSEKWDKVKAPFWNSQENDHNNSEIIYTNVTTLIDLDGTIFYFFFRFGYYVTIKGSSGWWNVSSSPILDEYGNPVATISLGTCSNCFLYFSFDG